MANREPVNYIVTYGDDANDHANWEVYDEYEFEGAAKQAIELLLPAGWSSKLQYVFPNGIVEFRIFETSAHRLGYVVPVRPDPIVIPSDGSLMWDEDLLGWDLNQLLWL